LPITYLIISIWVVVIIFSLTIHEYSHGRVALSLGDDTAQRMGRLSFNPLKHLDPFGVACFYFIGIGWAKPVPVDWRNFQNPHKDMMYVALAGPASNVVLAVICSFFLRMLSPEANPLLFVLFSLGTYMNVVLALFNMLPIFPLDGGSVIKGLVPHDLAEKIGRYDRFGAFLILGIFLLDKFAGTQILSFVLWRPIMYTVQLLAQDAYPILEQVLGQVFALIF
jgi:Zn-dependent protease